MSRYNFEIGTTLGNMTNLEDLGLPVPYQEPYIPYSVEIEASDLSVKGHGIATTAWRYGFITQANRDILKAYCPDKSSEVFIRIYDDDNQWVICNAIMIWPNEHAPVKGKILDLAIEFRILESYGAGSS